MKIDYHMHFEYGDYTDWAEGFFTAAQARGIAEIGISEHSHTFPEFKELYYQDLILDNSPVGEFQQKWLRSNKFKHTLADYFDFMADLKERGFTAKVGIEVCNFQDQAAVKRILDAYPFDYIIGSIHFLDGWGFDASQTVAEWDRHDLEDMYKAYTEAACTIASTGSYDILGHPFNLTIYKHRPDFDPTPYYEAVLTALAAANMAIDINSGTKYRYPVGEITPNREFIALAYKMGVPVITSSDAHKPEDCGYLVDEATELAASVGYGEIATYTKRERIMQPLG